MQEAPWTKTRYKSASEESAPGSGANRRSWRRAVAIAGIAALLLETIVALMQAPRTEPLRDPGVSTLDWWRYPIERNAIQRMPRARGPLSVVQITRDGGTDQVWFAGAGGLIIHSRDGGRTWDSTTVSAVPQHASAAPLQPQKAAPLPAQNPAPRISPRQPARQPVDSGRVLKKADLRGRARSSSATRISLVSFDQQKSPVQQKASPVQQQYDPKSQSGRPTTVAVPNVIGRRWQEAEKALFGASLEVRLSYTPVSDSSRADRVVAQSPAPSMRVRPRAIISLLAGRYVPAVNPPARDTSDRKSVV